MDSFTKGSANGYGEKNPEVTVSQIREAMEKLLITRGWPRKLRDACLQRTAEHIHLTQQRNEKARVSHRRKRLRELHSMGYHLTQLRRCDGNQKRAL